MDKELTPRNAMDYMRGYWPNGKRFTPELMVELVRNLKVRKWEWGDFTEGVKKYREHYNWTGDEKYKQSPDWGQLVKLHKPQWQIDNEKRYGTKRYDEKKPEKKDVLPIGIHANAMSRLRDYDIAGYCQVMVEYYEQNGDAEKFHKWQRYLEQSIKTGSYTIEEEVML